MSKGWWVKVAIAIFVTLVSIYTVIPTFVTEDTAKQSWYSKLLPKKKVKLGLDLKGGLSLTLGVDTAKAIESESQLYIEDLKRLLTSNRIPYSRVEKETGSSRIDIALSDPKAKGKLLDFISEKFSVLEIVEEKGDAFVFDLTAEKKKDIEKYTIEQMLETQRNRIDEYGVVEPEIRPIGGDRILIELPGIKDASRAQSIIEKTAHLEFKLVDKSMTSGQIEQMVEKAIAEGRLKEGYKPSDLKTEFEGKVPGGRQILFEDKKDDRTGETTRTFYLVHADASITGKYLEDARVGYDQFNKPQVDISFNTAGADIFRQVTTDNVGEQLAIVLDEKVYSAPVINTAIPNGRGVIEFGGMQDRTKTLEEATDLSIVLRAGSLPAPVEVLENRIVGPSLGKDSIEKGARSVVIGTILVIIFMLIYYGVGGFFADIALILNLLMILAMMIAMDATLTLPGIAGIALSLGMAVDANVLINERIREESRSGKMIKMSTDIGFKRTFLTILDSNLTTVIAAVALFQYGTGPIKGFAVTLMIGIVISFYTAFAIVKLMFEYYVFKFKKEDAVSTERGTL